MTRMSKYSQRVSQEQKAKLLEFMKAHEDLARGRVVGPDAARTKKVLLEELSLTLNAFGSGAQKTPDKWWKCWQDWKSDVKAKASKINKHRVATGGGSAPPPLSSIEVVLMQFWGVEMVKGLDITDPLQESAAIPVGQVDVKPEAEVEELSTAGSSCDSPPPTSPSGTGHNQARDDLLLHTVERQAVASERLAVSMERIATAFEAASAALVTLAASMQQRN